MREVKVDFSNVPLSEYLTFMTSEFDIPAVLRFADKAVVGGVMDRPLTDFPAITAKLIKALNEETDTINLAVASMSKFMTSNEEDDQ